MAQIVVALILTVLALVASIWNWTELKKTEATIQKTQQIRQEIQLWERALDEKSNYRDVLLRLALLNYQINQNEEAKDYWGRANYLDPNNEEVVKVGEIISRP